MHGDKRLVRRAGRQQSRRVGRGNAVRNGNADDDDDAVWDNDVDDATQMTATSGMGNLTSCKSGLVDGCNVRKF